MLGVECFNRSRYTALNCIRFLPVQQGQAQLAFFFLNNKFTIFSTSVCIVKKIGCKNVCYYLQKYNSYRGHHNQFPGKRELRMDPSLSITCVAEDLSLPSKKMRKSSNPQQHGGSSRTSSSSMRGKRRRE